MAIHPTHQENLSMKLLLLDKDEDQQAAQAAEVPFQWAEEFFV